MEQVVPAVAPDDVGTLRRAGARAGLAAGLARLAALVDALADPLEAKLSTVRWNADSASDPLFRVAALAKLAADGI